MNDLNNHPSEEELSAFALDNQGDENIRQHVETCCECRAFVDDVRLVCDELMSIKEESVPSSFDRDIISFLRKPRSSGNNSSLILNWYIIYGIVAALLSILFNVALIIIL